MFDPQHALLISEGPLPVTSPTNARPKRTIKPPLWLKDYVVPDKGQQSTTKCLYPIADGGLQWFVCSITEFYL